MSKGTPIKTAIANWEAANEGQKAAESEKVSSLSLLRHVAIRFLYAT